MQLLIWWPAELAWPSMEACDANESRADSSMNGANLGTAPSAHLANVGRRTWAGERGQVNVGR